MSQAAPTSGWFEARTHVLPVRVYYEDTDFTGLVYHGSYVRWLERGRSDFLRLRGVDHRALMEAPDPCAFVVRRMVLEYRGAARIDEALLVRTTFDSARGASLNVSQSITRGDAALTEAKVHVACITAEGRPRRPPEVLYRTLAPVLLEPPKAPRGMTDYAAASSSP